jgi:hypothetical protein
MDGWIEKLETYRAAESVMKEAKLFYVELVFEERLTRESVEHFEALREMSEERPEVQKILQEMQGDAQEKKYFSNCLEM